MDSEHDRQAREPRRGREVDSGVGTGARGLRRGPEQPSSASSPGCRYAIRVEGLLDVHWSEWLGGMTLTHEEGSVTRLEGSLIDQAALHGVLNKLRDLRLTLITLERLGIREPAAPAAPELAEGAE
jgi:hypothetical protein